LKRAVATIASCIAFASPAAEPPPGRAKAQGCIPCHGALGISTAPDAPNLAGQPAIYTAAQLKAFRAGSRRHEVMNVIAKPLTDDDIDALAQWFASVPLEVREPR
jgi:cytochrome c553